MSSHVQSLLQRVRPARLSCRQAILDENGHSAVLTFQLRLNMWNRLPPEHLPTKQPKLMCPGSLRPRRTPDFLQAHDVSLLERLPAEHRKVRRQGGDIRHHQLYSLRPRPWVPGEAARVQGAPVVSPRAAWRSLRWLHRRPQVLQYGHQLPLDRRHGVGHLRHLVAHLCLLHLDCPHLGCGRFLAPFRPAPHPV